MRSKTTAHAHCSCILHIQQNKNEETQYLIDMYLYEKLLDLQFHFAFIIIAWGMNLPNLSESYTTQYKLSVVCVQCVQVWILRRHTDPTTPFHVCNNRKYFDFIHKIAIKMKIHNITAQNRVCKPEQMNHQCLSRHDNAFVATLSRCTWFLYRISTGYHAVPVHMCLSFSIFALSTRAFHQTNRRKTEKNSPKIRFPLAYCAFLQLYCIDKLVFHPCFCPFIDVIHNVKLHFRFLYANFSLIYDMRVSSFLKTSHECDPKCTTH